MKKFLTFLALILSLTSIGSMDMFAAEEVAATVEEATKALKRGKAARVDVLTLSRVLRPLPS